MQSAKGKPVGPAAADVRRDPPEVGDLHLNAAEDVITRTYHHESFTMSGTGYNFNVCTVCSGSGLIENGSMECTIGRPLALRPGVSTTGQPGGGAVGIYYL
jgi:hypothetical protein